MNFKPSPSNEVYLLIITLNFINQNTSHAFIAGGEGRDGLLLGSAYFLNLDTGYWASIDDKLDHARTGHVCGFASDIKNSYAVVAGGFKLLPVELLDLKNLRWKPGPFLPFEMDWAAGIQIGQKMLIVGGEHIGFCSKQHLCHSSNAIFEMDLADHTWKAHSKEMTLPRSKHIVLPIPGGGLNLCQLTDCSNCQGTTLGLLISHLSKR